MDHRMHVGRNNMDIDKTKPVLGVSVKSEVQTNLLSYRDKLKI